MTIATVLMELIVTSGTMTIKQLINHVDRNMDIQQGIPISTQ